jgi:signal transduction histidine kinase
VIINLLNNSRDELIKKDSKDEKLIFIGVTEDKNNLVLEIKDNAGGISEDIIDRVFEPYFTTKYQSQGTGIGLYMSNQIIAGMEGFISVLNEEFEFEGKTYTGAVFKITIPLVMKR